MRPSVARTALLSPLAVAALATSALAGSAQYPDGREEKLVAGGEVIGPAVVTTDDRKGVIRLRPGAVLRYLGADPEYARKQGELFFLKDGAAEATLGHYARLATPAFWAVTHGPDEQATLFVATLGKDSGYARVQSASKPVRLILDGRRDRIREFHAFEDQGLVAVREEGGSIRFRTDAHNAWEPGRVRLLYSGGEGPPLDLHVPKATEGAVSPMPQQSHRFLVEIGPTSWIDGRTQFFVPATTDSKETKIEVNAPIMAEFEPGDRHLVMKPAGERPKSGLATVARENSNREKRYGTQFFDGAVEVVALEGDLLGERPRLVLTIEHTDGERHREPITALRWRVEFVRNGEALPPGEALAEWRQVPEGLKGLGDRVELVLDGLEKAGDLVGAWPVLHLTR